MVSTFNGQVSLSGLQTIGLDQLSGACITDSSNSSSSTVAASAHALSNIAMTYLPRTGGTISGDITVSGKYHGDGSLLTGISGGGGGAVSGIELVNTSNNNSSLVIASVQGNWTTNAAQTGVAVYDPGGPFDGLI